MEAVEMAKTPIVKISRISQCGVVLETFIFGANRELGIGNLSK
jgi:hypothetical protein